MFDFFGDSKPMLIAWTAPGSTNGWLALDRNGNGIIDRASGSQLLMNWLISYWNMWIRIMWIGNLL
jgi:hypothetical protein